MILLLAAVLALASADTATVGASAIQLRHDLGINNTDVGLLVTVTSLVAAAASLPFGVLADRVTRTRVLGGVESQLLGSPNSQQHNQRDTSDHEGDPTGPERANTRGAHHSQPPCRRLFVR